MTNYKPVPDATSPYLRINVTEENITLGVRGHSGHCMVAEAIKETAPWAKRVSVDLQTCRMTDVEKGLRYNYLTPMTVQYALLAFDSGEDEIAPFCFVLRNAHVTTAGSRATAGRQLAKPRTGHTPVPVGGKPPPLGPLNNMRGKRREFGLRSMSRFGTLRKNG
jgi:hypothetical protein